MHLFVSFFCFLVWCCSGLCVNFSDAILSITNNNSNCFNPELYGVTWNNQKTILFIDKTSLNSEFTTLQLIDINYNVVMASTSILPMTEIIISFSTSASSLKEILSYSLLQTYKDTTITLLGDGFSSSVPRISLQLSSNIIYNTIVNIVCLITSCYIDIVRTGNKIFLSTNITPTIIEPLDLFTGCLYYFHSSSNNIFNLNTLLCSDGFYYYYNCSSTDYLINNCSCDNTTPTTLCTLTQISYSSLIYNENNYFLLPLQIDNSVTFNAFNYSIYYDYDVISSTNSIFSDTTGPIYFIGNGSYFLFNMEFGNELSFYVDDNVVLIFKSFSSTATPQTYTKTGKGMVIWVTNLFNELYTTATIITTNIAFRNESTYIFNINGNVEMNIDTASSYAPTKYLFNSFIINAYDEDSYYNGSDIFLVTFEFKGNHKAVIDVTNSFLGSLTISSTNGIIVLTDTTQFLETSTITFSVNDVNTNRIVYYLAPSLFHDTTSIVCNDLYEMYGYYRIVESSSTLMCECFVTNSIIDTSYEQGDCYSFSNALQLVLSNSINTIENPIQFKSIFLDASLTSLTLVGSSATFETCDFSSIQTSKFLTSLHCLTSINLPNEMLIYNDLTLTNSIDILAYSSEPIIQSWGNGIIIFDSINSVTLLGSSLSSCQDIISSFTTIEYSSSISSDQLILYNNKLLRYCPNGMIDNSITCILNSTNYSSTNLASSPIFLLPHCPCSSIYCTIELGIMSDSFDFEDALYFILTVSQTTTLNGISSLYCLQLEGNINVTVTPDITINLLQFDPSTSQTLKTTNGNITINSIVDHQNSFISITNGSINLPLLTYGTYNVVNGSLISNNISIATQSSFILISINGIHTIQLTGNAIIQAINQEFFFEKMIESDITVSIEGNGNIINTVDGVIIESSNTLTLSGDNYPQIILNGGGLLFESSNYDTVVIDILESHTLTSFVIGESLKYLTINQILSTDLFFEPSLDTLSLSINVIDDTIITTTKNINISIETVSNTITLYGTKLTFENITNTPFIYSYLEELVIKQKTIEVIYSNITNIYFETDSVIDKVISDDSLSSPTLICTKDCSLLQINEIQHVNFLIEQYTNLTVYICNGSETIESSFDCEITLGCNMIMNITNSIIVNQNGGEVSYFVSTDSTVTLKGEEAISFFQTDSTLILDDFVGIITGISDIVISYSTVNNPNFLFIKNDDIGFTVSSKTGMKQTSGDVMFTDDPLTISCYVMSVSNQSSFCFICPTEFNGVCDESIVIMNCKEQFTSICSQCDSGYYYSPITQNCLICGENIKHCMFNTTTNETDILLCDNNFELLNGICKEMNSNCLQVQSNKCMKCIDGMYSFGNVCISCENSLNVNGNCEEIDYSEIITNDNVISCNNTYFLKNKQCLSCSTFQYCLNCDQNTCKQCESPYILIEGNCVSAENCKTSDGIRCIECVDDGMILDSTLCFIRSSSCLHYDGINCVECVSGTYLHPNGDCIDLEIDHCLMSSTIGCIRCNDGYYGSGVTSECDTSCVTCFGTNSTCLSCSDTTYLEEYECRTNDELDGICELLTASGSGCALCSNGYFRDGFGCHICSEKCSTCNTNSSCLTCTDETFMYANGKCKNKNETFGCAVEIDSLYGCGECISGYYLDDKECKKCSSQCLNCSSYSYPWTIADHVVKGKRLPQPKVMSDVIFDLISNCWCQDPNQRHNSSTIVERLEEIYSTL
ncbi:Tyrosine kinase [Entamoeba marina]